MLTAFKRKIVAAMNRIISLNSLQFDNLQHQKPLSNFNVSRSVYLVFKFFIPGKLPNCIDMLAYLLCCLCEIPDEVDQVGNSVHVDFVLDVEEPTVETEVCHEVAELKYHD
jgi:hypothetical protein